jgi:hypothetical protein
VDDVLLAAVELLDEEKLTAVELLEELLLRLTAVELDIDSVVESEVHDVLVLAEDRLSVVDRLVQLVDEDELLDFDVHDVLVVLWLVVDRLLELDELRLLLLGLLWLDDVTLDALAEVAVVRDDIDVAVVCDVRLLDDECELLLKLTAVLVDWLLSDCEDCEDSERLDADDADGLDCDVHSTSVLLEDSDDTDCEDALLHDRLVCVLELVELGVDAELVDSASVELLLAECDEDDDVLCTDDDSDDSELPLISSIVITHSPDELPDGMSPGPQPVEKSS